jgi:putative DNA-binding protein
MRHSVPLELARLERGFLAFVTGNREPPAELADAREQLTVYRRMYALRMARELAREFPATRALLGTQAFDAIARRYVARHASRSFTLEGYGAALPDFMRRARVLHDAVALAALERALVQVRAGGPARLVRFGFDVELGYARFARGAAIRRLHERITWLVLFERGGRVARMRVAAREVAFLRALLTGADLERAVAIASASGLAPAAIRRALERWVGSGPLRACYRSGSPSIQAAPWKPRSATD